MTGSTVTRAVSLLVDTGKFSDPTGNKNTASASFSWTAQTNDFVTKWTIPETNPHGTDLELDLRKIMLDSTPTQDFTINWGDGDTDTISGHTDDDLNHTYTND